MKIKPLLKVLLIVSLPLFLTACSSSGFFSSGADVAASPTDISRAYLTEIFGSVQGALIGNGQQVIGKMFYQFNLGVLSLIGIMLCYSIFSTSLRCANEGSFQNQGKSIVYVFIKIIVGITLVIPSTSTGYCIAQEIVMKTVMASISAADALWDECLDYIGSGHSLFSNPSDDNTPTLNDILVGPSGEIEGAAYNAFMGDYSDIQRSRKTFEPSTPALGLFALAADTCMVTQGHSLISGLDSNGTTYQFPYDTGACGKIDLSSNPSFIPNNTPEAALYMDDVVNAISAVAQDMLPAGYVMACKQNNSNYRSQNEALCASYNTDELVQTSFFNADIDYTTNILPIYDDLASTGSVQQLNTDLQNYGEPMVG